MPTTIDIEVTGSEIVDVTVNTVVNTVDIDMQPVTTTIDLEFVNTVPGPPGADGADGSVWLRGTGAPSDGVGNDGDYYIDDASITWYGPKAGGTWTLTGPNNFGDVSDHGSLTGLGDDDHTQYHNDTRGDARYYQKAEHLDSSSGAGDAGKPVKLDAAGHIDASMVNDADIDHGSIDGLADDDHTQYHNDTRGDARYYQKTEHLDSSAGAGDAGKPVKLDAAGHIDASMVNDADIDHGSIGGLADDDHTQYSLADGTRWTTTPNSNVLPRVDGSGNLISSDINFNGSQLDLNNNSLFVRDIAQGGYILIGPSVGSSMSLSYIAATNAAAITGNGSTLAINGVNGLTLQSSGGVIFLWPAADGSAGDVLSTDGAGNLSFITPSSGGGSPLMAQYRNSPAISINVLSPGQAIWWGITDFADAGYSIVSNSRITFANSGRYLIKANINYYSTVNHAAIKVYFRVNGTTSYGDNVTGNNSSSTSTNYSGTYAEYVLSLNAGDYVEVMCENSGIYPGTVNASIGKSTLIIEKK